MPVQHLTLARFRPALTPAQRADAFRTTYLLLAAALAGIPGIIAFNVGPPLSARGARGYQFAMSVEFRDLTAFREYIPHAHHRLVADFVNGFSEGTPLSYQIDTARAKL